MAYITKEDGTIIARQGDTGQIYIEGLDTDKNYAVYFGVYDENRKAIGNEVRYMSNFFADLAITIPASVSDMWTVPKNEEYKDYFYGIKVCDDSSRSEETITLSGCEFDTENIIRVYPKKVEGLKAEDYING